MSLLYKGTARDQSEVEVEIPTESFRTGVKIRITKKEKGDPRYPKSYRHEQSFEVEMERDEFRTMINCLDSVI